MLSVDKVDKKIKLFRDKLLNIIRLLPIAQHQSLHISRDLINKWQKMGRRELLQFIRSSNITGLFADTQARRERILKYLIICNRHIIHKSPVKRNCRNISRGLLNDFKATRNLLLHYVRQRQDDPKERKMLQQLITQSYKKLNHSHSLVAHKRMEFLASYIPKTSRCVCAHLAELNYAIIYWQNHLIQK